MIKEIRTMQYYVHGCSMHAYPASSLIIAWFSLLESRWFFSSFLFVFFCPSTLCLERYYNIFAANRDVDAELVELVYVAFILITKQGLADGLRCHIYLVTNWPTFSSFWVISLKRRGRPTSSLRMGYVSFLYTYTYIKTHTQTCSPRFIAWIYLFFSFLFRSP